MTKPFLIRDFDGISPGLTHPEKVDSFDGLRAIGKLVSAYNSREGWLVIPAGENKVTIDIGADYDGNLALASINAVDGALSSVIAFWDGNGVLTILGNANAAADLPVSYKVFDIDGGILPSAELPGGGTPPGGQITTGGAANLYTLPLAPELGNLTGLYLDAAGFLRPGAAADGIVRLAYSSPESIFDGPPSALIIFNEATNSWDSIFGAGAGAPILSFLNASLPTVGGAGPITPFGVTPFSSIPVLEESTIAGAHGPDPAGLVAGWTITYATPAIP